MYSSSPSLRSGRDRNSGGSFVGECDEGGVEGWSVSETIINISAFIEVQALTGRAQRRIGWVLIVEGAIRVIVLVVLPHPGRSCSDIR